jgi:uncharacterized membrane protein
MFELLAIGLVIQIVIIFLLFGKVNSLRNQILDLKDEFYDLKHCLKDTINIEKTRDGYSQESTQKKPKPIEEQVIVDTEKNISEKKEQSPLQAKITENRATVIAQDIIEQEQNIETTQIDRVEQNLQEDTIKEDNANYSEPILEQKQSYTDSHTRDGSFLKLLFSVDNILVKIGAIVLFFGLAFLAKYAILNGFIGIKTRFIVLGIIGIALGDIGYFVRNKNRVYAMIMQGLGIAVLYLTIYSASKFYNLFSLNSAFIMMLIIVVIGSILALMQDSLELAMFSVVGGFLAPILVSSGDGNYKLLFGYYALLNVGIFIISYKKAWRVLNLVGFTFTFIIGTAWAVLRYSPDKFAISESFLIFNFLLYLAISIMFVKNQKFNPKGIIDTTLTFGLPAIVFSLQHYLVRDFAYGDAISATVLATVYFWFWFAFRGKKELLSQAYFAISIIFITMAVAYYFSRNITSILWALEGSLVIWLSIKQNSKISRYFGEAVLILSIGVYLINNVSEQITFIRYFGYIAIIVALVFASLNLKNIELVFDSKIDRIFLSLGAFIATISTSSILNYHIVSNCNCLIASILLVSIALYILFKWSKWEYIEDMLDLFIPLGFSILIFLVSGSMGKYSISWLSATICLVYISFGYFMLLNLNLNFKYKLHILNFLFLDLVLTYTLYENTNLPYNLSYILPSMFFAIVLSTNALKWLISGFEYEYKTMIRTILIALLAFWQLMVNHYMPTYNFGLPILNKLEFAQITILFLIANYAFKSDNLSKLYTQIAKKVLFILSFIFITAVYARAVSHYAGLAYDISIIKNATFQAGLSIIWSIFGIAFMLLSKKQTSRVLWVIGMGLLLIVVAKLFLIDLANSATIQRVISFIGVGALMLIIGYFVPLPPSKEKENEV